MTKDEMWSVFDGGDAETALVKLAVSFPGFGLRDLKGVLGALASAGDSYYTAPDPASVAPGFRAGCIRSRRQDALRTIFFIMFETGAWDRILAQPDFLPFVRGVAAACWEKAEAGMYRSGSQLDLCEAFDEMRDRLAEKLRAMPEGAACAGGAA